jgi:hypothetical protein
MGSTFTVIAARGTQQPGEIPQLDRIEGGDEWFLFRPSDRDAYPSTIRDLTHRAAKAVKGVALAGFVEDSDFAFLLAATSEGAQVWLLIDPEAAEDYREAAEALQLSSPQTGDEPERFAVWSKLTPKPVDSDSLRQLLAQETVFSEEPMMAIFESLGIHVPWNATS